ncbi:MAG TPA: hypothetical protein DC054_19210 [Blastocatellia bacterium]|nr:hypothetical protein [Blastocatellia bacterium]
MRNRIRQSGWTRLLLLCAAVFAIQSSVARSIDAQSTNGREVAKLKIGKPVEREIGANEHHTFAISLLANQFVVIEVEQRGIDVLEQITGPDQKSLSEFDREWRPNGVDRIEFLADKPDVYQLNLRPSFLGSRGHYEVRLIELRDATETDRLVDQAHRLSTKAKLLERDGKFSEAQTFALQAVAAQEKAGGPESAYLSLLLSQLGWVQKQLGKYTDAEKNLLRAINMSEKLLGPEHPHTAYAQNVLGLVYRLTNDFAKSSQLLEQSANTAAKLFAADDGHLLTYWENVSLIRGDMGDAKQARVELERATAIAEKTLAPDSTKIAALLNNLGLLYQGERDYDRADKLFQKCLAIYEQKFGPDHPSVATELQNMGIDARQKKDYDRAIELYQRALAIREKTVGPEHPNVAALLNNIANIYHGKGDYLKALETQQRALAIAEKSLGPYHGLRLTLLDNIARSYMALGDTAHAIHFQSEAEEGEDAAAELDLMVGSERQKLAYLDDFGESSSRILSLNLSFAPADSQAATLATLALLRRKGRVLDAMSDDLANLRQRSNAEDRKLLDDLRSTIASLAKLALNGPGKLTRDEFQKQLETLTAAKEKLEATISTRSAEFSARSRPVTLDAVQSSVPANAALIEFAIYRPFDPKAANNNEAFGKPRYAAYLVRPHASVVGKDLGDAEVIDRAIAAWREALRDPQRSDARELARAVDDKVLRPVRALFADATQLLVSPDGELNLVPFAALVDEQGRYLIQRYSFTYLTSGRDLLRMPIRRESQSGPLIVANPTFGEQARLQSVAASTNSKHLQRDTKRRSITSTRSVTDTYFAPLDGTESEARSIQTLFPDAKLLTGVNATETAVKQAAAPSILHLSTHGFFLSEPPAVAGGPVASTNRPASASTKIENPLLRSGLALAGANLRDGKGDDGILTALEASDLNLWGTKLVVLSACDTGLGEVRNGEGVYGLRRAFTLAGAESLVMSLWPISDFTTRELMTNYYKNLKQGLGRGEALRQVQLDMLKKNARLHPFYWANFIQAGEWANLDGKR